MGNIFKNNICVYVLHILHIYYIIYMYMYMCITESHTQKRILPFEI